MRRAPLAVLALFSSTAVALSVGAGGASLGCGGADDEPPRAARADAPDGSDASIARDATFDTAEPDEAPPRPAYVPDGWELWGGYRKACGLYIPSSPAVFPSAARWRPCAYPLWPSDMPDACEEWALNDPDQLSVGTSQSVAQRSYGEDPLVGQVRAYEGHLYSLTVNARSGDVRDAVLMTQPQKCSVIAKARNARGALYSVFRNSDPVGAYFREHDARSAPAFSANKDFPEAVTYDIGTTRAFEEQYGALRFGPWSNPRERWLYGDPARISVILAVAGDTAIFSSFDDVHDTIRVARPNGPLDVWFDNEADPSQRVAGVATDEVDVAWTRAEQCNAGKPCGGGTLFTAKMPAPGGRLVPHRLRSENYGARDHAVGCGHVANVTGRKGGASTLRVARLADGISYELGLGGRELGTDVWSAVAVTCEHVYFVIRNPEPKPLFSFVRVPIGKLGPEIAPD